MVNPDGLTYDLGGSPYRSWRKNRQPTPGSESVGTGNETFRALSVPERSELIVRAFAPRGEFDAFAAGFFRHVNGHFFDWLVFLAVYFFDDDAGLADLQFVTFAAHSFDQNSQVQFTATSYFPTTLD